MSTSSQILFTATEVAQFAGVSIAELRDYEPEGFGSPGHWRLVGASVVYTVAGCRWLAQALSMAGHEVGAQALLDAVNAVERAAEAPAQPAPQKVEHNWMTRADLQ